MKLSTKIIWGAGFVSVALLFASLVIWLMGLFFNGIFWLSTEGGCMKYTFSETQNLDTCELYK